MEGERYVVQVDFYLYAKSDKRAVRLAMWIVRKICAKFDNQARVAGVWSQPFGSLESREVKYEG